MKRTAVAFAIALAIGIPASCGGGTDPSRLDAGACFDLPSQTDRIGDVTARSCTEPHRGEVFHVFETDRTTATYPIDLEWEEIIYPICDPFFEAYTGTDVGSRTDIDYRYLVPTEDRWAGGDRRVTCFIVSPDGSPLTRSFRAGA
jgi:hypothetical protein